MSNIDHLILVKKSSISSAAAYPQHKHKAPWSHVVVAGALTDSTIIIQLINERYLIHHTAYCYRSWFFFVLRFPLTGDRTDDDRPRVVREDPPIQSEATGPWAALTKLHDATATMSKILYDQELLGYGTFLPLLVTHHRLFSRERRNATPLVHGAHLIRSWDSARSLVIIVVGLFSQLLAYNVSRHNWRWSL